LEEAFDFDQASDKGKIYFARLNKELETIIRLKFSKYFLLVWDIYKYCRKEGIATGAGRGSGAGSLVCYLLGITNADPIHYGLIFERFVNPERIDIPDLDLDFQHDRREEVYQYILNTYKHVAHISTFSNMNTKGVIKDVCRFREVPLAEADAISKEIDANTSKQDMAGITLKVLDENPNKYPTYQVFKHRNPAVIEIAKVLEGQVRQSGVHAGGVIVSAVPLEERCSVEWRKGQVCINYDMHDMNDLGLLKVDCLGLKTVTILDRALKLSNEKAQRLWSKSFELDDIPLDDKKTLSNFDKGETIGVFQFESQGMQQMLKEMAPHDINTVITANAMYRPGPLQFKDLYVKQKKNPSLITSTGNDALDTITKETYGVFIYQEQVMRIAVEVAGFTYPEADVLRKKISKSKGKAEIETSRDKFVAGCVDFGKMEKSVADHLFDQIVDFGRYCFNKSHATTYSISSYYAMWFKTHFPHEFMLSQIYYSDDKEERNKFINESKRIGLTYATPDINLSEAGCSIQSTKDGKLYLLGGLSEIDGIGNISVSEVLRVRGDVPFTSFQNFYDRLDNKRAVNIGVQEKLLQAGVFNSVHNPMEVKQICFNLRSKPTPKKKIEEQLASLF
jgi:DNA polymerase-3 subunit alpha